MPQGNNVKPRLKSDRKGSHRIVKGFFVSLDENDSGHRHQSSFGEFSIGQAIEFKSSDPTREWKPGLITDIWCHGTIGVTKGTNKYTLCFRIQIGKVFIIRQMHQCRIGTSMPTDKPCLVSYPVIVETLHLDGWKFDKEISNEADLAHEWRRMKQSNGQRRIVQLGPKERQRKVWS